MYEVPSFLSDNHVPVRTNDPRKKDYSYFLKNCQANYSIYYRGGARITYSAAQKFAELRAFATGTQDENFYKRYLSKQNLGDDYIMDKTIGIIGKNTKAKGFLRPLWDILSPAPNIIDLMVSTLTKTKTDIYADPIDAISKSKEEDAELESWVISQNLDLLKQAHAAAGLEMPTPDFLPESQEELKLFSDMGGFKPAFARVMEKLILHTQDISDWEQLEIQLYKDAITLGVIGVKEYYDPEYCKYRLRVVDPARAGVQYCESNDCRTAEWAYEFREETISTIKQYFPDKTEEDWEKLAYSFCGYMGNPFQSQWANYKGNNDNGFMKFDFFRVPVMDCSWIDDEATKQVIQKQKHREIAYEVDLNEKVDETLNKKGRFTTRRYVYNATWIIGTNDIYNWGKAYDNAGKTQLPYHFYVWDGKSKIQRLIPLFHNFQVLWLKYLNALALAVNSGFWINADMLANIASGGDTGSKESDKEIAYRRFLDTGNGFYSRINPGLGTQNLQDLPVTEFRGGMGQIFLDIMQAFDFNARMVESITGVNPIILGQTPNPNAPVGTTQIAASAVLAALKPLQDGFLSVKLGMAKNICRLIHICIHAYPESRKLYERVVGDFDMQILAEADRDNTEYSIRLDARPNETEKQAMIETLKAASVPDKSGNTSLSGLEVLILIRRLEAGIPMAQIELEFEVRKRRNMKESAQIAQTNSTQQAQVQMQSAQQAAQLALQTAQAQHQMDMELQQLKNQGTLAAVELQEGIRKQKESEIQSLKSDAERYLADSKANAQRTTDYVKANTATTVEQMKTEREKEKPKKEKVDAD